MLIEDSNLIAQHNKSAGVSHSPATNALGGSHSHIKSPNALSSNTRYRQDVARRNLFDNAMKRMQEYLDKQKKSTER